MKLVLQDQLSFHTLQAQSLILLLKNINVTRTVLKFGVDLTIRGMINPAGKNMLLKNWKDVTRKGARGVGELGDKGLGEFYSKPTAGWGLHIDDPQMKPLLEKCAELHMPVSIHVAEDAWMYENADSTNDGLMNAATWKVDMSKNRNS